MPTFLSCNSTPWFRRAWGKDGSISCARSPPNSEALEVRVGDPGLWLPSPLGEPLECSRPHPFLFIPGLGFQVPPPPF